MRDFEDVTFAAFELRDLETRRKQSGKLYHEFLRVPALSAGLYRLEAGAADPQQPHAEDEVYVVMAGRGAIIVGDERREVGVGSVVFVPRTMPHRFVDIAEALEVLVLFAPAESS
jgi:mannose-6-phosphate isomerase-like protein (cupin superfamily)